MTFTIEVLLKDTEYWVAETIEYEGNEPGAWTEDDVARVLKAMLLAVDRIKNPDATERTVALRGLSWIVTTYEDGVAIAIEIPIAAVVAGPFTITRDRLDAMITRVLAASGSGRTKVH